MARPTPARAHCPPAEPTSRSSSGPHVMCVTHAAEVNRELRPRARRAGARRRHLETAVRLRAGSMRTRAKRSTTCSPRLSRSCRDRRGVDYRRALPIGGVEACRIVKPLAADGKCCPPLSTSTAPAGCSATPARTIDSCASSRSAQARRSLFVEYPNSPEARYPVAIEQGYATAQWVVREGSPKDSMRTASRSPASRSAGT